MKKTVSIIGDRHCAANSLKAIIAEEMGKALIDEGFRVMTGGVGGSNGKDDGVMEFALKGAHLSDRYQEGDTIGIIPGFDIEGASRYADIILPTGLDMYRNVITANADAVIAIGGGAGTLCEMANAWSLGRLIIAFDNVDGWSRKLAGSAIDNRNKHNLKEDVVWAVDSIEKAIDILKTKIDDYSHRHSRIM